MDPLLISMIGTSSGLARKSTYQKEGEGDTDHGEDDEFHSQAISISFIFNVLSLLLTSMFTLFYFRFCLLV